MTIIAGIERDGRVHMVGDSCMTLAWSECVLTQPKVFLVDGIAMGVAGSARFGCVMQTCLSLAARPTELTGFRLAMWVANKVRAVTIEAGLVLDRNASTNDTASLLLGLGGELWHVDAGFAPSRMVCGYNAMGNGADVALGALHVASASKAWLPMRILHEAALAAADHCPGVRPPFCFVSTEVEG